MVILSPLTALTILFNRSRPLCVHKVRYGVCHGAPPATSGDTVRRRPKDRKAQIARASAEAFSTLGFHGVSMEAIASRVGISAPALYRHYASKYELFRDAVLSLGQQLVDCTAFADEAGAATRNSSCAG